MEILYVIGDDFATIVNPSTKKVAIIEAKRIGEFSEIKKEVFENKDKMNKKLDELGVDGEWESKFYV